MGKTFCYMPLLRTRGAELKAYEVLGDEVAEKLFPIFELTRARRSKYDREGDVSKNIEKIKELVGGRWFALDLTTTEQQGNGRISEILGDGANGFGKWVELVEEFDDCNIVPAVHMDLDHLNVLTDEVSALLGLARYLLLRVSITDEPLSDIEDFVENVPNCENVILLIDREYIGVRDSSARVSDQGVFRDVCQTYGGVFHSISYVSSSFPSSVVLPGYGGDSYGFFPIPEVPFFNDLSGVRGQAQICYSDYATVHPLAYPGGGGGWVPRVDFPLGDHLFYHRYRRDDGGYVRAASEVERDRMYVRYPDWGCNEIELASIGLPNGRGPSHWISVRMSLHMSRMVDRFGSSRDSRLEL